MKDFLSKGPVRLNTVIFTVGVSILTACSSTKVKPLPKLPPAPDYLQVTHPPGYEIGDLNMVMRSPRAPREKDMKDCTADFYKLSEATNSHDEIYLGARELVRSYPERYHWCFYYTLYKLHERLGGEQYLEEKQAEVLKTYEFIVPVAQGFRAEFQDTRYLRWALTHYKKVSKWVFYRSLKATPQTELDLMQGLTNPFSVYRQPSQNIVPVLEKYDIKPATRETMENKALDDFFEGKVKELPGKDPVEGKRPASVPPNKTPSGGDPLDKFFTNETSKKAPKVAPPTGSNAPPVQNGAMDALFDGKKVAPTPAKPAAKPAAPAKQPSSDPLDGLFDQSQ